MDDLKKDKTTDTCTTSCYMLYCETMEDVRATITKDEAKRGWAIRDGCGYVEFCGPDGFFWSGQGCCLYNAKTAGWRAYLAKEENDRIEWLERMIKAERIAR